MTWIPLTDENELRTVKEQSYKTPVMIFKHSTSCSTSAVSLDRLQGKWKEDEVGTLKAYFLDLLRYRSVSNEVATLFGITNQSPQLLLIKDGIVTYQESHFGINYAELLSELRNIKNQK